MKNIIDKIKDICPSDIYEIEQASLSGLLKPNLAEYEYALSIARKLDDRIIDEIKNGPTKLYYEYYNEVNNELNEKTEIISALLEEFKINTFPIKATVMDNELDYEYKKDLRYFFSHKMAATRSGIGWIGKTDLLVTFKFGTRVRLSSILMTESIGDSGIPVNESKCGSCNICVIKCPIQAANGQLWSVKIDRNDFYDPFKCRKYCKAISKKNIKENISLCGICLSVCPKSKIKE